MREGERERDSIIEVESSENKYHTLEFLFMWGWGENGKFCMKTFFIPSISGCCLSRLIFCLFLFIIVRL